MPPTLDEQVATLHPDEAADRLGLRPYTLRQMRRRGDGPPYLRIGNRVRYRMVDLADWLTTQVRTTTTDPEPSE